MGDWGRSSNNLMRHSTDAADRLLARSQALLGHNAVANDMPYGNNATTGMPPKPKSRGGMSTTSHIKKPKSKTSRGAASLSRSPNRAAAAAAAGISISPSRRGGSSHAAGAISSGSPMRLSLSNMDPTFYRYDIVLTMPLILL